MLLYSFNQEQILFDVMWTNFCCEKTHPKVQNVSFDKLVVKKYAKKSGLVYNV